LDRSIKACRWRNQGEKGERKSGYLHRSRLS
jgi:hypothetical protein